MQEHTPFPVLNRFITSGGTIDVGRIETIECAAVASDAERFWVALTRRDGEPLHALLQRLNDTLEYCLARNEQIDELERTSH
jgi:hypothetical protein